MTEYAEGTGWQDFIRITGMNIPAPMHVVHAHVFRTVDADSDSMEAEAAWKTQDGYAFVTGSLGNYPSEVSPRLLDDAESLVEFVRIGASASVASPGNDGWEAACWREVGLVLISLDARVMWQVSMCEDEFMESSIRTNVGLYDNADLAHEHARGASLAEQAVDDDPESLHGRRLSWEVEPVILWSKLPPLVAMYASGTLTPQVRPQLSSSRCTAWLSDEDSPAWDWTVTAPGQGNVRFTGHDAENTAARFFLSIPRRKSNDIIYMHSLSGREHVSDVARDGLSVTWKSADGRPNEAVSENDSMSNVVHAFIQKQSGTP